MPEAVARDTGNAIADSGGFANTGVITGPVTIDSRPVARSAYRQQVQRIAPSDLLDREQELAELAAFCTLPDAAGYRWWRADAWAGKSALMSWFVLHPPHGVRLISFFITARWAGQSDRVAFTDVVIEQLAELLGEPMPAHYTDATRDQNFLDLLDRAAETCQTRGERLILLIDGLDEDRGSDTHSIAALLPATPPAGMRIIVSGRPNPPIPTDVPDGHPLRDPRIVRLLNRSPQAEVNRADMLRELARLLSGAPAEQDLLGLLTAAGGGLSGNDLADLTGWPAWQLADHLSTVAGRSFTQRPSRWQPNTGPDLYVLGHEELQSAAVERLGQARLEGYRQRLHVWADTCREQRWPAGTPEYLLRGYYRMLLATGDLSRMIACAVDPHRHDRMLDITGGDTAALAEITTTQDAILAQPDPDLLVMARLAVHRDNLAGRNATIPTGLPAVWASLGQPVRAEALARSIDQPGRQALALADLATTVARDGDVERAGVLADRAEALIHSVADPHRRVQVWIALAGAVAQAGDAERVGGLADRVEELVRAGDRPDWQPGRWLAWSWR
ncbi:hypothetical protein JNW90_10425 [Micromonospora sp. STR1s_5]|nr:hypothetical protein [Micromonospora sp. STR1s_5]